MKKKLEAELISIAHRILKLKNKSELIQLHQETQKLYEKLSVLVFVEENFGEIKPTIGLAEIEDKIESAFENQTTLEEITTLVEEKTEAATEAEPEIEAVVELEPEIEEEFPVEATETESEKILEEAILEATEKDSPAETATGEDLFFKPAFELTFDAVDELKTEVANTPSPVVLEDLLGPNYADPVFVKPEDLETEKEQPKEEKPLETLFSPSIADEKKETNEKPLNERVSKGITIGLNDRLGFIKHLFADNAEDYNRVLSQLITLDSMQEVQSFIDDMVKPDYNNWDGKEEYAQRFMEIIEKKFS